MAGTAVSRTDSFTQTPRLVLIVPLAVERQCLSGVEATQFGAAVSVLQSGQGAQNAANAARTAIDRGATALLSIGVAGGLSQETAVGDVVVPDAVVEATRGTRIECAPAWAAAIRDVLAPLRGIHAGCLLSVPEVIGNSAARQAAADAYGAIACDMESAAIAAVAADAQVDFATLRVISDAFRDELPEDIAEWVDSKGNARISPVLSAIMTPARWRSLYSMAARFRLAQRRLRRLSEMLAPVGYCCLQS